MLEDRVEFCSAIGGDVVAVHPPKDASNSGMSLKALESVRPFCEDRGIALAIENGFPADDEIRAQYFERFPPEFIGMCFDSGHANLNGNSEELMKSASRLRALHLHDNKGLPDDHQPPFYGTADWPRVLRWVDQTGYPEPVNFEMTHRPKYFEGGPEEYLDYAVKSIDTAMSRSGQVT